MTSCKKALLQVSTESPEAPEIIEKVRSTRYSIARRYGRISAFGHQYVYSKRSDTLIRADIYQQQKQQRRQAHIDAQTER